MKLEWRTASEGDIDFLAEWNQQMIRDDRHRNSMTVPELAERIRGWFARGEYSAVIFSDGDPVCYALFKRDESLIHVRQFFVRRDRRRRGIGRAAIEILRREVWPSSARLTVEVHCGTQSTAGFWRSVGYRDYVLTMEILPP
jgi:GNAT superfamily N-acetyltransferase